MSSSDERLRVAAWWTAVSVLVTMGYYYWQAVPVHAPRAAVDWLFVLCTLVVLGALVLRAVDHWPRPQGALVAAGGLVSSVLAWMFPQPVCAAVGYPIPSPYALSTWLVHASISTGTVRGVEMPVLALGAHCPTTLALPVLLFGYLLVFLGMWYDAGVVERVDADPESRAQCHSTPK